MTDEVLSHLVQLGKRAEAAAVRLSQIADRQRDDESRRRAADAWRDFETRWEAVRADADAGTGAAPGPASASPRPFSDRQGRLAGEQRALHRWACRPSPPAWPPSPGPLGKEEARSR